MALNYLAFQSSILNVPDEGLSRNASNVPDEGLSRNASCTMKLISTFLLQLPWYNVVSTDTSVFLISSRVKKDNIPIFHGETKRKQDNECRVRTKLYDKRDDFNFPIVNFAFICSNIPAAPIYGVYISQLIRYSKDYDSYHDFLDRG